MAGYTNSAFRRLIKFFAPQTITFSEFASADGLKFGSQRTLELLKFHRAEKPFVVQIFGKKPENFVEAAKIIEQLGAAGVDLNFGCPARKVVNSDHGSALLKNPELAEKIIRATGQAVRIPVSVKMRLGIADASNLIKFAKMVEAAGAKLLTIHGRTAQQKYSGIADYEPIYAVAKVLKIPVIGNGDITSVQDFQKRLQNLAGLMIGRAALARPWLLREIANFLQGKRSLAPRSLKAKVPTILRHARLMVATKGEELGMRELRKFLVGYARNYPQAKSLRAKLVRVSSFAELQKILQEVEAPNSRSLATCTQKA